MLTGNKICYSRDFQSFSTQITRSYHDFELLVTCFLISIDIETLQAKEFTG
jgi:hypothetical protein